VSILPIPPEYLAIKAASPVWFRWALDQEHSSHIVTVETCPIHYLLWPGKTPEANQRGILLVHGGGAHANWWTFIAPYFTRDFRVAAIDLSGMGDSGQRRDYSSELRAKEMAAVIEHAGLGPRPFVVGHSFGGFMTMKFASTYGPALGGAVIVDSPIRSPEAEARDPRPPPPMGNKKTYATFEEALARFRLMPAQPCENDYIVEFIARHSLKPVEGGWAWKFDADGMGSRRFGEPFREYLQAVRCRAALIFGEKSKLVSRRTASYMSSLMGPQAPVVEIPEAEHHVMLDQPIAFVAAVRMLLESWVRAE
jgi:pimeloyl-ACP methyl ester carboxylesterase